MLARRHQEPETRLNFLVGPGMKLLIVLAFEPSGSLVAAGEGMSALPRIVFGIAYLIECKVLEKRGTSRVSMEDTQHFLTGFRQ